MSITKLIQDTILFDDCVGEFDVQLLTLQQKAIELKKQVRYPNKNPLHYAFGLWTVTNSRKMLWDGFSILGYNNVAYYDTDSYKGYFKQKDIDKINKINLKYITNMQRHYGFDDSLVYPKAPDGTVQILGQLETEKPYDSFKTLGAKKYAYTQNGEMHITVAGLSKKASDYLNNLDEFNDEWYVPPSFTRKMSVSYDENQPQPIIYGHSVPNKKAAILSPVGFTVNMTDEFLNLIKGV